MLTRKCKKQLNICNTIFNVGQRIIKGLREKLFGSIVNQEVAFFDRTKTGELVNRLSTDTSVVGQSVTMNISDGLRSSAQAGIGLGMMVKRFLLFSPLLKRRCSFSPLNIFLFAKVLFNFLSFSFTFPHNLL